MKTTAIYHASRPNIPYPNAATRKEIIHKFLDTLLVGAMGAGGAAILLLLLALH